MPKRWSAVALGFLIVIGALVDVGCGQPITDRSESGWITLLDGSDLDQWNAVGTANWRIVDGAA